MEPQPELVAAFLKELEIGRTAAAQEVIAQHKSLCPREIATGLDHLLQRLIFQRICEELAISSRSLRPIMWLELTRDLNISCDSSAARQLWQMLDAPRWGPLLKHHGATLLGEVYEFFVGHDVDLASSSLPIDRGTKIKKSRGIYYTPQSVVAYITQRTLNTLLADHLDSIGNDAAGQTRQTKPQQHFTVLDPACGSGVFLLEAYQQLLNHFRDIYVTQLPHSANHLFQSPHGEWHLTLAERQRILLAHVYGVDVDANAVEVTKHALIVKMYEDVAIYQQTPNSLSHLKGLLTDLSQNIKSGNSLIGSDFRETNSVATNSSIDGDHLPRFDWKGEFPGISKAGGFDAIVGNPPYLNIRRLAQSHNAVIKDYLNQHYETARGNFDLYILFIERSFHLLKDGGRCGLIVPNKIASLDYARECRRLLLEQTLLDEISDLSQTKIFPEAGVYPYLLFWNKRRPSSSQKIRTRLLTSVEDLQTQVRCSTIRQSSLTPQNGFAIHGILDVESRVPTQSLGECSTVHSGTTGFYAAGTALRLKEWTAGHPSIHFEFIVSGNIDRYRITLGNVRFMKRWFERPILPDDDKLTAHKRSLYSAEKIVIAGMTKRLEAAFDQKQLALGVQVYAVTDIIDDPRYLLGLLNSKLLSYLFQLRYQAKRLAGGYLSINKGQLAKLPIRVLDLKQPVENAWHQQVVKLVDKLVCLHGKRSEGAANLQTAAEIGELTTTDQELDRLIYKLYALTDEEVQAIEKTTFA